MTRLSNKNRRPGYQWVELVCGHFGEISCRAVRLGWIGNTQRCVFDGLQVVKRIIHYEWHYRCNSCRHQYWGRLDREGTYAQRDKHREKHPTHLMTAVVMDKVTEDNKGTAFKPRRPDVRKAGR